MKNFIWLASYPKSGNTMLRIFLSSYFFTEKGFIKNFDILKNIISINQKSFLKKLENYEEIINQIKKNPEIIQNYWIKIQHQISEEKKNETFFIKTHNANINYNSFDFTNKDFTKYFFYIVRDPRSILISLMSHFEFNSYAESKRYLLSDNAITNLNINLPEIILSWRSHYISWKNFYNHNKNLGQIIKYEDMVHKPETTFRDILETICEKMKLTFDEKKYQNSLESLNFTKLQKMENEITFHESVHKNQKFFRKGIVDEWKSLVPGDIIKEIEKEFFTQMKELGYL